MSNTKTSAGSNEVNLNNKEAVDKLKILVSEIMVCLFFTDLKTNYWFDSTS